HHIIDVIEPGRSAAAHGQPSGHRYWGSPEEDRSWKAPYKTLTDGSPGRGTRQVARCRPARAWPNEQRLGPRPPLEPRCWALRTGRAQSHQRCDATSLCRTPAWFMSVSGTGRGSQAVYPLVLQALVAEHVRDILAMADDARGSSGAGLEAPAQTLIRRGR